MVKFEIDAETIKSRLCSLSAIFLIIAAANLAVKFNLRQSLPSDHQEPPQNKDEDPGLAEKEIYCFIEKILY